MLRGSLCSWVRKAHPSDPSTYVRQDSCLEMTIQGGIYSLNNLISLSSNASISFLIVCWSCKLLFYSYYNQELSHVSVTMLLCIILLCRRLATLLKQSTNIAASLIGQQNPFFIIINQSNLYVMKLTQNVCWCFLCTHSAVKLNVYFRHISEILNQHCVILSIQLSLLRFL